MNSRLKTWNSFSKNINNQQIIKGNQLDYTLSQKIYLFDLHYIFQQSQRLICSDKVDFITTDEPLGLLKDIMKVK